MALIQDTNLDLIPYFVLNCEDEELKTDSLLDPTERLVSLHTKKQMLELQRRITDLADIVNDKGLQALSLTVYYHHSMSWFIYLIVLLNTFLYIYIFC